MECTQQVLVSDIVYTLLFFQSEIIAMAVLFVSKLVIQKEFSKPIHARIGVTAATSPCPTLSADAEPEHKHAEAIFCAQCAV